MTTILRSNDARPELLSSLAVAVVGYGNQGRAQARNLRDSGAKVLIGNIEDDYRQRAIEDGFEVHPIGKAVADADVTMLLLPDEVTPAVYRDQIAPALRSGSALVFASGYNVAFGLLHPPEHNDVLLIAPRMIGIGVRDLYLSNEGFYSFVAVHQDVTGKAWEILRALCGGIGTLGKGAVEVTFRMEAELDLFNEQGFGPAFGKVLLSAIDTLVEAGYPREVVLLEIYMSGELGYIFRSMAQTGLIEQLKDHSQTSQYGALSRGIQFLGVNLKKPMRRILKQIVGGQFAREWQWEQWTGRLRHRFFKAMALRQPIGRIEREARAKLAVD